MTLTDELRAEYQRLFDTLKIRSERIQPTRAIAQKILDNWARYEAVAAGTAIPWWAVALVHRMEGGGDFGLHFHNGDSLKARTVRYPAGRPVAGDPPFTFEESAVDSIRFQHWDKWSDWTLPGALYKLESYNGMGYRKHHPDVLSPYLWSGSNHYTRGKYTADGRFDPKAISKQIGAAVILKELTDQGKVVFV